MPDAASTDVVGDLRLWEGGILDGWCWSPSRPEARLTVEIEADARLIASVEAAAPRPDLAEHGIGDGVHAFSLRLPPGFDRGEPTLISARERMSGRIFGRAIYEPLARKLTGSESRGRLRAALDGLSGRLTDLVEHQHQLSARLGGHAHELATVLSLATTGSGAVAAARALLQMEMPDITLSEPSERPAWTLAVPAASDLKGTLTRLAEIAPASRCIGAEVLIVHTRPDARTYLLPSIIRALRLCHADLSTVVETARADRLAFLAPLGPFSVEALGGHPLEFVLSGYPAAGPGVAAAPPGIALAFRRTRLDQRGIAAALWRGIDA